MSNVSLSDFASKVRGKDRICFGDVQRLQRNVLPDGIGSREDAELLISLDREIARIDRAWDRCLVALIVDFVVWAERPTGVVDEDTACWLNAVLSGDDGARPTKTGRLIAREIAEEAHGFENEALTALGAGFSTPRTKQTAPGVEPASLAA
jgi:hypothetical protein